jgi:hypothetical protein
VGCKIFGSLAKAAANLFDLEEGAILHLFGIGPGGAGIHQPIRDHVLSFDIIAVEMGLKGFGTGTRVRTIHVDPQLLPGFATDRLLRAFSGSHVAAHAGVPSSGEAVFAGRPLLQVQPTGAVKEIQVYCRLDQLRISMANTSRGRTGGIAPSVDQLKKLILHDEGDPS